jgi:preprotein translocase subunit YajC
MIFDDKKITDINKIIPSNVEVERFTAIEYIVLVSVIFLFVIIYFIVRSQLRTGKRYENNLLSIVAALKKIVAQGEITNKYIKEINDGVTKEGTIEQIKEFTMYALQSFIETLSDLAMEVRTKNNIVNNQPIIKGRIITLVTNENNKMYESFEIFNHNNIPLSKYFNDTHIYKLIDEIYSFIYESTMTQESLNMHLQIIIDEMYNQLLNNLMTNTYSK